MRILDATKQKWIHHKGVQKLEDVLNFKETCGYITFINTGVPDIGCEQYDVNVHLVKPKRNTIAKERRRSSHTQPVIQAPNVDYIVSLRPFQLNFFFIFVSFFVLSIDLKLIDIQKYDSNYNNKTFLMFLIAKSIGKESG